MFRGMYTSATGLINNQRKMDTISNNLSNVNTSGYKKDGLILESFPEVLMSRINDNSINTGRTINNAENTPSRINIIGTMGYGVRTDRVFTNFIQGNMMETGNHLDLALSGEGFFRIQTEDGIRYTRDGSFKVDQNGTLVTNEGHQVLGTNGAINIGQNQSAIDEQGNILLNGQLTNTLDIININNVEDLRKEGDNLYTMEEGTAAEEIPFNGEVLSGYLESSNVEPVKEMVEMISSMRHYESSQKVVQAYDEILGKAVNDIART